MPPIPATSRSLPAHAWRFRFLLPAVVRRAGAACCDAVCGLLGRWLVPDFLLNP